MKKDPKWTVLQSKSLLDTPWLGVEEQSCQLESGKVISPFYIIHQPSWVLILAVSKDGKIPMVRQYRHGTQRVYCEFPAGNLESGEDPLECARRELLEETGYSGGMWSLGRSFPVNPDRNDSWFQIVLARDVEPGASGLDLDDTEELQSFVLTLPELRQLIVSQSEPVPALHELAWALYLRDC